MAQTTGQIPLACGQLEISSDGTNWTDVSGSVMSLSGTEQARNTGEGYTLDGDTAIVESGKRAPIELVIQCIYTESNTEVADLVRAEFEAACGDSLYVRWSPDGGSVGNDRLTSGAGEIVNFQYPPMDATAGGPIITSYTVRVPSVTTAAIAS
jgi:hypothetical protein